MTTKFYTPPTATKAAVHNRYQLLLKYWNERNVDEMTRLFDRDGILINADGSQLNGQEEIETSLRESFGMTATTAYVAKVKEIRNLSEDVFLLRAVAGIVEPGHQAGDPEFSTIQSMIASRYGNRWNILMLQNTPLGTAA